MQADKKETATVTTAGGKPPTMCDRLQRAFHTKPAFRPLRRLTGRPEDGGAAATPAAAGTTGTASTHGRPPPKPVAAPVGNDPAPVVLPSTPLKPAAANEGGKAQHGGKVPAASTPTVTVTTANVAEKKKKASGAAGGMPVPAPPSAVAGGPPVDEKAGDKAQQTKGKTRLGSRVRKALTSSK